MMRHASFWLVLWLGLILGAWACQPQDPEVEAPSPPPQPTVAASLTPSVRRRQASLRLLFRQL